MPRARNWDTEQQQQQQARAEQGKRESVSAPEQIRRAEERDRALVAGPPASSSLHRPHPALSSRLPRALASTDEIHGLKAAGACKRKWGAEEERRERATRSEMREWEWSAVVMERVPEGLRRKSGR